MSRRTPLHALLVAGLAIVLAACSGSTSGPSSAPSSSPSPAPSSAAASTATPTTYVALGDSYSAGSLIPVTDVANGCFRSDHNYPALVAQAIGATLTDRTCGGARTTDFSRSQLPDVPPQRTALTADTELVTVGLGGNDGGVFSRLTSTCPAARSTDPDGSPCEDELTSGGSDQLSDALERTERRLTAVLRQVHRLAPKAQVLAIGYPQIVDASHVCDALPLATGDYAYATRVNERLDDAVRAAAEATGSTFVDVYAASEGHDICSDDPWINGSVTDRARALAYHPFAAEHEAVAKLVEEALR